MSVTIKDLATMAGTSTATVSRVLSNKPGVAESKRQNILRLADKLGYMPNRIAQNLALQKSHLIGLVAAELRSSSYVDFFRRIQHRIEEDGYRVLIADSELDVEKEKHNIHMMRQQRVEGLIVFPVHDWKKQSDVEHFLQLKLQRFPFVLVGRIEGYGFDYVTSEEVDTAYRLTKHLINLGHKRFLFVGTGDENRCIVERREGFEKAIKEAGAEAIPGSIGFADPDWAEKFDKVLSKSKKPSAIIFVNDVMALTGYRILAQRGLRIPDDVAVAAFGDNIWCQNLVPSLTTAVEDNREVARLALDLLMKKIADPGCSTEHLMQPQELVIRESCGGKLANV